MKENYEQKLEFIGKDELDKRVKMCETTLNNNMMIRSQSIFKNLLSEEFNQESVNQILQSIIDINNLQIAHQFVENGIINSDLAQKLDKLVKKSD